MSALNLLSRPRIRSLAFSILSLAGLVLSTAAQSNSVCTPAPAGLVAWWRGEGNALDSVGTNHGTLRNGAGFAPGAVGQAFALDGFNDFVLVPDSASLRLTGALTFELWFKATSSQWGGLFDKRGGGANYGLIVSTDYGVQLYYDDPAVFGGDHPGNQFEIAAHFPLPSLNVWHHFAGTYRQADPSHIELKMYIDGALVESRLFSGNLANTLSAAPVAIGGVSGSCCYFPGLIDEVSLYNRALAPDEIGRLHAAGPAGKCITNTPPVCVPPPAGLVAWWPFEGNLSNRLGGAALVPTGSPAFTNGAVRQGLSFDGTDDSAVAAASPSLDIGAGPGFSVELWVNPVDLTSQQALLEWSGSSGGQPGLHLFANTGGSGTIFVNLTDINSIATHLISPPGTLVAGVFQHVLLTYDRTSGFARTYHNGRLVAEGFIGNLQIDTRPDLYFGRRILGGSDYRFSGVMDEVSLYNRALAPAEITALFAAGSEGKCFTNTPPPQPPFILSQPLSQTVFIGDPAGFSVTAGGDAPLRYQWRFQGSALNDQTNAMLFIAAAQPGQAGDYTVVVANPHGAVTSAVARLTVLPRPQPPFILSQPQSLTVYAGDPAGFSVTAGGDAPLLYQWHFQGGALGDQTNATLSIAAAQSGQAGDYTVVVANPHGAVTSAVARLTVMIRPTNDCTSARSIADVLALVERSSLPSNRKQPLRVSLEAAQRSVDRSNVVAAVNQIEAFQNKVRAQVARIDPVLAECLLTASAAVIQLLENPPAPAPVLARIAGDESSPATGRGTIERSADGSLRLTFQATPQARYLLQASPDLHTWSALQTVEANAAGWVEIPGLAPGDFPARFFRLTPAPSPAP